MAFRRVMIFSQSILLTASMVCLGVISAIPLTYELNEVWAIIMTMAGSVVVGYGDLALSGQALLGDALAKLDI